VCGFFFEKISDFQKQYGFEESEEEDSDYAELSEFGFLVPLKALCNGDITKREQVLDVECATVYMWLKLLKTEAEIQKKIIQKKRYK
jgi:hypothetical protein